MRKLSVLLLGLVSLLLFSVPLAAQDDIVIASGLTYPRGIAYDADGNLWVAEAGTGGTTQLEGTDEFGQPISAGATADVLMISPDGTVTVVLPNLPSYSGGPLGVQRVLPTENGLWLVMSEGPGISPFNTAVVQLEKVVYGENEIYRVRNFIDLLAYEIANNPDTTEEVYSNPNDIDIAPDGTVYILDTGANTLYSWAEDSGLTVFKTWDTNPVPVGFDFAEDGTVWVAFLGQGIATEAGSVKHYSADGSEELASFDGYTAVTDVLVASDGSIYFAELAGFGPGGPQDILPGTISRIVEGEVTAVAEGLNFPFALAEAPDGGIVASVGSVFVAAGDGSIIRLPAAG